jgi:hypothetical protein
LLTGHIIKNSLQNTDNSKEETNMADEVKAAQPVEQTAAPEVAQAAGKRGQRSTEWMPLR